MELVCSSSSPPGCWFIFWIRMRWGHLKFTLHVTAGIEQIMKHSFWFLKQFSTTFFCVFYSLLTDELTIFVMPEVQTLGVGSCETFYGGHASLFHAHQLVSYPKSGREVNVKLDPFAHWWWNIVFGNTEIHPWLESGKQNNIMNISKKLFRFRIFDQSLPVNIDKSQAVPNIFINFITFIFIRKMMFTQTNFFSILSFPCNCWSAK